MDPSPQSGKCPRNPGEDYSQAWAEVLIEFHATAGGHSADITAVFRREGEGPGADLVFLDPDHRKYRLGVCYRDNEAVFIQDVEIVERKKLLVPSVVCVRFKAVDGAHDCGTAPLDKAVAFKPLLELSESASEGKLNLKSRLSLRVNEQDGEMVPRGPQVVNRVTHDKWQVLRQLERVIGNTEEPVGVGIRLDRHRVNVFANDACQQYLKLVNVVFRPIELKMGATERVGCFHSGAVRALGD